jgi:hypothetical protein
MKDFLILIFALFQLPSIQSSNHSIKNKKIWRFGTYTVSTGSCNDGSAIEICQSKKILFSSCGGDGKFGDVDAMDINGDGFMDFVFVYKFDDNNCLGMLISKADHSYESLDLLDDLYSKYDCSTKPYNRSEKNLKEFSFFDVNNDGEKDVVTMVYKNKKEKVILTDCSRVILHKELVKKLKAPNRRAFPLGT